MPTSPLNQYLIGLGSNLGEREALLAEARRQIGAHLGTVEAAARAYATAPMGAADQPFLNSAVVVSSALAPGDAMRALLAIEASLGRVRTVKWGNRTIDLDLLLWNDAGVASTYEDDVVTIPHPHLLERDFALVPAAEIAPGWTHPVTGLSLADECSRRSFKL